MLWSPDIIINFINLASGNLEEIAIMFFRWCYLTESFCSLRVIKHFPYDTFSESTEV